MLVPCTCAAFADSPCATNALSATAACATIVRRTRGTGENGGGTLCPHHQILDKGLKKRISSTFVFDLLQEKSKGPIGYLYEIKSEMRLVRLHGRAGCAGRSGQRCTRKNRSIAMTMHAKAAEQQNKRKNTADPQGNSSRETTSRTASMTASIAHWTVWQNIHNRRKETIEGSSA